MSSWQKWPRNFATWMVFVLAQSGQCCCCFTVANFFATVQRLWNTCTTNRVDKSMSLRNWGWRPYRRLRSRNSANTFSVRGHRESALTPNPRILTSHCFVRRVLANPDILCFLIFFHATSKPWLGLGPLRSGNLFQTCKTDPDSEHDFSNKKNTRSSD